MSKLNAADLEQMIRLRARGWSYASIGKRLGVSGGAINYQCLKLGVTSPRQTGRQPYNGSPSIQGRDGRIIRRFSEADDARLNELAGRSCKIDDIARELGRARSSIRMRLLRLGQHEDLAA